MNQQYANAGLAVDQKGEYSWLRSVADASSRDAAAEGPKSVIIPTFSDFLLLVLVRIPRGLQVES